MYGGSGNLTKYNDVKGGSMVYSNSNNESEIQGYLVSDICVCVEQNKNTYIKRFRNLPKHKFNWCAAIFGAAWCVYRLMFKYGLVAWLLKTLIFTLIFSNVAFWGTWCMGYVEASHWLFAISVVFDIAFFVIMGVYADALYWKFIKENIDCIKKQDGLQIENGIGTDMKKRVGVHWGGAIVMFIGIRIAGKLYSNFLLTPLIIFVVELVS